MKYRLSDIEFIKQPLIVRFVEYGIENTDQLLIKTAQPAQRVALATKLDITESELLQCASIADFVRIKGVGPKVAVLLTLAGLKNSQELSKTTSTRLFSVLTRANRIYKIVKRLPTKNELLEYIEEAGEVKARLVVVPYAPALFNTEVRIEMLRDTSSIKTVSRAMLIILVVVVLILDFNMVSSWFPLINFDWSFLHGDLADIMRLGYLYRALLDFFAPLIFSILGLLILVVFSAIASWWSRTVKPNLIYKLFDKPLLQRFYLYMKKQNNQLSINRFILLSIALVLAYFGTEISFFLGNSQGLSNDSFLTEIRIKIVSFIFFIIVALLAFNDIYAVWVVYKKNMGFDIAVIHRYLSLRMTIFIVHFLAIWCLISVLIPLVLTSYRFSLNNFLIPEYLKHINSIEQEILGYPISDAHDQFWQQYLLDSFERDFLEVNYLSFLVTDSGIPIEKELIPATGTIGVWGLISIFLFYFIVPFFFLSKPQRALILLGLIFASYFSEEYLIKFAPPAFFIPNGSLVAILLIIIVVISNSFVFDWFEQTTLNHMKQCPICGREIKSVNDYCPECDTEFFKITTDSRS